MNVAYFDSFGKEDIPKETKKITSIKIIIINTCRKQVIDSAIGGYFTIRFIDFIVKLYLVCNSYSTNEYEKNDKIILKYFQ